MTDVVIVGAGPTGLTLACELALAGIGVEILERRAAPVPYSKALTMHPRTIEVAAMRGLADRFLAKGMPLPTGHYGLLDTRLDFSRLDSRHAYTLFIPQAVTEKLLTERAAELGVTVRRGCRVETLEQDADGVRCGGTGPDGPFAVEGRYLVGADGARSAVRDLAGIGFPGAPLTTSMALGDVVLARPPATPMIATFGETGTMLLVSLGSFHRVVVIDPARTHVPVRDPLTLEELAESTRRIHGDDFGMADPLWLSRFGDETRLADQYRMGRVMLAGDAAHIHLPAGGQGMNVGVQDAFNLGWKLAAVLNGTIPESLLDSYEAERRPVGASLIENTYSQSAIMTGFTPDRLALRRTLNAIARHPDVNRDLAAHLAAFDIRYPALPLDAPLDGEWHPVDEATGQRVPDFDLDGVDGADPASLFAALGAGRWLLLHRAAAAPRLPDHWTAMTTAIETAMPTPLLAGCDAALIRPDGHVGWAWRRADGARN